ncbi:MAG: CvpA family protein [Gemmatimonadaceae bacterium]|nr:CvpA family protein [Acetobacteraceae bacterium]
MNWVDLAVLGVVLVSGLLAVLRGMVREVLGIAAWVAAALAASPYGAFPYVAPWVRQQFSDDSVADAVAFGGVFLIVLVVLSLIVGRLSNAVQGSALGGLDRTLGLVFGLGRGAALLVVAYILAGIVLAIEQWPAPVLEARSLPYIHQGAVWTAAQLPPLYRPAVARPPAGRTTTAADLMRANPAGRALGTRPIRE